MCTCCDGLGARERAHVVSLLAVTLFLGVFCVVLGVSLYFGRP